MRPPLLLALLAPTLLLVSACACPPVVERYDDPEATLATWQGQLCHDDIKGEYRCLSAGLQAQVGNFSGYWTARDLLLEDQPLLATGLRNVDLTEHVASRRVDQRAGVAELTLDLYGNVSLIRFRRETLLLVELGQGPPVVGRSELPLSELFGEAPRRRWVELSGTTLHLTDEQRAGARSLLIEQRWKIDAIDGLVGASP